ncbi:4a-hydroxytetrahydrobiopterin dehydratase [Neorhizobium alkalisoli]|uniref:Putative pterin-4-alpha-carbinolamine dehydratase n=1 Tax=Neorhizobium alkalisoli TaxID=528178 RepID=A0A561QIP8_9HYPH|nr:4a-hydroxytetrahydrobiopterin dehydratase [Neorhizobium alkalisoli]TWF50222.1 4a-hydroxytetrahydrobiopterin dehydratase [Neorhizobium alkalisoli]
MRYETLDAGAVQAALETVDGWALAPSGKAITRTFVFRNFVEAFGFMTECALLAEKLDHHPDWSNSYSRVEVSLTTHVTKGLTDRDFKLAQAMDQAFLRRN